MPIGYFGYKRREQCVSLFYEKLQKSFELFVPVFRYPARPMTDPWYTRELQMSASYMDCIENGIKRDPKRFFDFANYKRKTVGYDKSVGDCPANICELCTDLFESVYNVDTSASDTEDVSGPSNTIRLRMSDLEATISGLDANKGPGNDSVPFLNSTPMG
jgi:hypothetical protein